MNKEKTPVIAPSQMMVPTHNGRKMADTMLATSVACMEWEDGQWCTILTMSSPIHPRACVGLLCDADVEHTIKLLQNALADNRAARAGKPMFNADIEEERKRAGKPS